MKEELQFGWVVERPSKMSVLTNDSGEVALIYNSKNFGDVQPLLLKLSEKNIEVISVPHYIDKIAISLEKVISVKLSKFVEDFEKNQE